MATAGQDALALLQTLWQLEAATARERLRQERDALPLAERVARGLAGTDLRVEELSPVPGGRVALTLTSGRPGTIAGLRLGPGDPVLLWRHRPDEAEAVRGVLGRKRGDALQVVVPDDTAELLEAPGFRMDRDAPDITTSRGHAALERAIAAPLPSHLGQIREALWGDAPIHHAKVEPLPWTDLALHEAQQAAVRHAASARPVALVHGPPGTGKTRVLVEVVRQALQRGERVLCTAASHAAVDHLVAQLAKAGLDVLRIGHPARLAEGTAALGLDARLEASAVWGLARQWSVQARALFRKLDAKRSRGTLERDEARALREEAKGLLRDARKQLDLQRKLIVQGARVIAGTAAGLAASALRGEHFDVAVVDEATQCADPMLLIPLGMATRAVLAGDPRQLPPTVVDDEAARRGLGRTAFERLAGRDEHAAVLLVRQHRMHADIMAFPSAQWYGGRLVAAPEVEGWRLEDLPGVRPDPTRDLPLTWIDAAGAGWQEVRDTTVEGQRGSVANPEAALRVVREVLRLVSRGVRPEWIAVLTPYDAQRRLLTDRLRDLTAQGLEVDTIDAFQGRESPAVVLDLVRSNDAGEVGFLADTRRLNVAWTRAQRLLLIVGDSATVGPHPAYAALLEAVERRGRWLSVFEDGD